MTGTTAFTLTEQQSACLVRNRLVSVEAGAGSGKTRVLIERYLRLLGVGAEEADHRYRLDEIVAITFTRKAAAEIKERLREALVAIREAGPEDEQEIANKALEDLGRARVGTIDSFFTEILREFPLAAGLDPGFRVLADQERGWLEQEAMEDVFRFLSTGHSDAPLLLDLDLALEAAGTRAGLENRLRALLRDRSLVYQAADLGAEGLQQLWSEVHQHDQQDAAAELTSRPGLAASAAAAAAFASGVADDDPLALILRSLEPALAALPSDLAPLVAALPSFKDSKGLPPKFGRTGTKKPWEAAGKDVKEARKVGHELAKELGDTPPVLSHVLDEDVEREVAAVAAALSRLAAAIAGRFAELAERLGAVDFQDIQEGVGRLLEGRARDRVLTKLTERFPVFLLDEMQDTNPRQWKLLSQLVTRSTESFLVGDPKQAIYAFRGADVRAFLGAVETLGNANELRGEPATHLALATNYRSAPGLLTFLNRLFEPLMAEQDGGFEVPFQALDAGREGAATVELLIVPPPDEAAGRDAMPPETIEANLIAGRIRALVTEGSFTYSEVAILLRRRHVLPELEAALRTYAVPYRVHGGIGFFQRQEVRDLANLLAFLRDREDGLALAAVLRSPFVGISDEVLLYLAARDPEQGLWENLVAVGNDPDASWPEDAPPADPGLRRRLAQVHARLTNWRTLAGRLPVAQLAHRVADEAGLWGALAATPEGDQAAENVTKLIDQLRAIPGDLADVCAFLRRQVDAELREGDAAILSSDEDAVQILTVHASKGLEFPAVFIPDLGRELRAGQSTGILTDPDGGLAFGLPEWRRAEKSAQSYAYFRASKRHRQQSRAEEKRLFYVACTRAQRGLFLAGQISNWSPVPRDGGKSWLDWVRRGTGLNQTECEAGEVQVEEVTYPIYSELAAYPPPIRHDPPQIRRRIDAIDEPRTGDIETPDLRPLVFLRPPSTISPTQLVDFACPRYYELRHVLGIDPASYPHLLGEPPPRRPSPEGGASGIGGAPLGDCVHLGLQAWVRNDCAPTSYQAGVDAYRRTTVTLPPEQVRDVATEATRLLEQFCHTEIARRIQGASERHSEVAFAVQLEQTTLQGSIDLTFRDPDWGWTVLDWKTSRPPPDGADTGWFEAQVDHFRPQLMAYALAFQEQSQLDGPVTTALHFLRPDQTWHAQALPEDLAAFRAKLDQVVTRMGSGGLHREAALEPVTPEQCRECRFRGVCPDFLVLPEDLGSPDKREND